MHQLSQSLLWLFLKKIAIFSQFYQHIFVNFKIIQYYKTCNLLFYTLLSSTTFLRFTKYTYNWHVPRKWIGSAITAITFPYFLMGKEKYNLLDYFRMGIIEEIRFFFFGVEDPTRNQKLCAKWCEKLKNKACGLRRKRV